MDGMPVNGAPVFSATEQGTPTLLVRTKAAVYALDPASGYNRWTYTRYGCDITGAALGTAGGLISQTCSRAVRCGKLKFCGVGPQLFLLPNGFDRDDSMKDTNPDHLIWNKIGVRATPVSADALVSALSGTRLIHYDAQTGATKATTALSAPAGSTPITATAAGDTELITVGGRLYAVDPAAATPRWTVPVSGVPSIVAADGSGAPALATMRVTVPTASGAATLDATTGRVRSTSSFTAPPHGAGLRPLGSGYLVTASGSTTAFG
jgi:outer membrane protein assembly factor BamB